MNPGEHQRLIAVASAIARLLPGASIVFRDSDYGLEASEVISFRVGPYRTVELIPLPTGWLAAVGAAAGMQSLPLLERRVETIAGGVNATVDEVAASFVRIVRHQVDLEPDSADRGLAVAFGLARKRRSHRALVISLSSVAGVLLLLGAFVGGFFVGATPLSSSSAGSGSSSGGSASSDGFTGTTRVTSLKVGDCFDSSKADDASGKILPTACTASHDSELFGIVTVPTVTDETGRLTYDQADELCYAKFEAYVGDSYSDSSIDYDVFTPSTHQFESGDRTAYCYIVLDSPRKRSVKGSEL